MQLHRHLGDLLEQAVDAQAQTIAAGEPLYDFTAADGVRHTIWRAGRDTTDALVAAFKAIPALYIADGHHRAASAARAREELRGRPGGTSDAAGADTFIAVAFPDNQVQILSYNRAVKDLNGMSNDQFLDALRQRLAVSEHAPPSPSRPGVASMYLAGRWYGLEFSPVTASDDTASLDVSRLQDSVLAPVRGIHDVRTDKRIDFIGGIRGSAELQRLVDGGQAAVAFALYPVTVRDLMKVADAGGIMPPKSTWFEPKLRDGLLSHLI